MGGAVVEAISIGLTVYFWRWILGMVCSNKCVEKPIKFVVWHLVREPKDDEILESLTDSVYSIIFSPEATVKQHYKKSRILNDYSELWKTSKAESFFQVERTIAVAGMRKGKKISKHQSSVQNNCSNKRNSNANSKNVREAQGALNSLVSIFDQSSSINERIFCRSPVRCDILFTSLNFISGRTRRKLCQ